MAGPNPFDGRTGLAAGVALLALAWWLWPAAVDVDQAQSDDDTEPTFTDDLEAMALTTLNSARGTAAAGMQTSQAGLSHLAQYEGLSLTRYRLGDGGWTLGRGRYFPDGGELPPERIDLATADAWFAEDVRDKGERWVKAYVTVPLTQAQFDALVSMAFNLKPSSFKRIADAVNAGEDPAPIALQYVRAGTDLERGLRRRRAAELAMFNTGAYA